LLRFTCPEIEIIRFAKKLYCNSYEVAGPRWLLFTLYSNQPISAKVRLNQKILCDRFITSVLLERAGRQMFVDTIRRYSDAEWLDK